MRDLASTTPGNDAHEAAATEPSDASLVPDRLLKLGRRVNGVGDASKGYADTLGQGFELALTLVIFGAVGWFIDRAAGTSPTFTIALGALGFVGISLKLWFGYDREMREHEDGAVWNRRSSTPRPTVEPESSAR
jgi:F0F1-type ATP synthase assembly protein I